MTYQEKLKHPKWQKRRLEILERDQFMCQSCESKENTLHVHHRMYIKGRDPWNYPDLLLITLCEGCHEVETEATKVLNESMEVSFHASGFLASELCAILNGLSKMEINKRWPENRFKLANAIGMALNDESLLTLLCSYYESKENQKQ